jgi:dipeptidyl aminopeptidase/acylaminoacyl peptidase
MKPLVPSDIYRLVLPGDPACAPDGRVFFVRSHAHEEHDRTESAVWLVRPGGKARRFTSGTHDRAPRVSPGGTHLAFIRRTAHAGNAGQHHEQIFVAPLDGGEAEPVTPFYDAILGPVWSPDGTALAYSAVTPLDAKTARVAVDERTRARHIRALPFKSDDEGLLDGRCKHLFVCALGVDAEPRRLTFGDFDALHAAWSPDGTQLAFDAAIDLPSDSFLRDIFVIGRDGGELRRVTAATGQMQLPAFSHDAREIAFIGHEHGDDIGGRFNPELLVVPVGGGAIRSLSAKLDRPVTDQVICDIRGVGGQQAPIWAAGDRELFVPLSSEGACGIAAFARDGSGHRVIADGERDIYAFSRAADGAFAFVYSAPLVPSEIAVLDPYGNEETVTDSNPWLAERSLRAPRRARPKAADGTALDLFLLDPEAESEPASSSALEAASASGSKLASALEPASASALEPASSESAQASAPWVLQVHGGPHSAYGFAFYFEFQMLASHGIGVAFGNPRGSQSYGHAYADAITGDWGGIDAADVLSLLDGAQANAPIDPVRIGLAGGSYGGFMTTWLLGHSDRFACGVSMRAVNDLVSEVGAADLGWFLEREVGAPWSDGGRKLFELSPMRAAHNIAVPLLVEHSERDFRCPIDQGEQLFTLLSRLRNAPVEFVRFTDDGHNLSRTGKPRNRVLRLRAIAHWFIRYLRPAGIEPAEDEAGVLFSPLPTEA